MQHNGIVTVNRVIYQQEISPELKSDFGYLTNKHEQLIQLLDLIDLDEVYPRKLWGNFFGRPSVNRHAFVIAFMARIVWNLFTRSWLQSKRYDCNGVDSSGTKFCE